MLFLVPGKIPRCTSPPVRVTTFRVRVFPPGNSAGTWVNSGAVHTDSGEKGGGEEGRGRGKVGAGEGGGVDSAARDEEKVQGGRVGESRQTRVRAALLSPLRALRRAPPDAPCAPLKNIFFWAQ